MFYNFLFGLFVGVLLVAFIYHFTMRAAVRKNEYWSDGFGRWYEIKEIKILEKL